ncbi:hypothetical protein EDB92DRAFT_2101879 [Lactarius akahatsu]|uniref:Uncharacterized protein n=1 Tax=Lactarius akahatsu TaxID=416441 RepID=A0AAD4LQ71_9AGAM|nr:hypothetical protein EDB92DRAFT_2101879 [Lactarius akahatsu]
MVYSQNDPDWPTSVERIILKGSQSWVELECPRTKEDVIASKRFTGESEDCTTKETLNIREKQAKNTWTALLWVHDRSISKEALWHGVLDPRGSQEGHAVRDYVVPNSGCDECQDVSGFGCPSRLTPPLSAICRMIIGTSVNSTDLPLELAYPVSAAQSQYLSLLTTFQTSLVMLSPPRRVGGVANVRVEGNSIISLLTTRLKKPLYRSMRAPPTSGLAEKCRCIPQTPVGVKRGHMKGPLPSPKVPPVHAWHSLLVRETTITMSLNCP